MPICYNANYMVSYVHTGNTCNLYAMSTASMSKKIKTNYWSTSQQLDIGFVQVVKRLSKTQQLHIN